MTKIYAILNVHTEEFQTYNGRCAWTKAGNAKNAFDNNRPILDHRNFDDYEKGGIYKIIELTEAYWRLEGLMK